MNNEKSMNPQERSVEGVFDKDTLLEPEHRDRLNKRHFQGALVRSGASLLMWFVALTAFVIGAISDQNFLGVCVSVLFLIVMNPPTLWILKRVKKKHNYARFSIFVNYLEIIAYTAIIYSLGGISGLWLSPILAALITYLGVVGPPRSPFHLAVASAFSLSLMAALEYLGVIPHMDPFWQTPLPLRNQIAILVSSVGLLFVVAFISSYTSSLMKKTRGRLRVQGTELKQSQVHLEAAAQKIEQQNIELRAALAKAHESDRMKSEFLANMSHELRTPLNHIIGFTELLVDKIFGALNKAQEEHLNDILVSGRHLLSLINDILDLSKVEAGKMTLELSPIDLTVLLQNSLAMIKEKAVKHGIRLSLELDGAPREIQGDERKLKQILYNLVSNAVKFTPDGGTVRLIATSDQGQDARQWIRISVADTGLGIKRGDLERIFEPFEQVESSVMRKYQGTGLGLSLARKFVELHGGKIWAESQGEGKGSCFHFTLPF
jgi:signal transduction histidine kinase